jgi:hypothetical protein
MCTTLTFTQRNLKNLVLAVIEDDRKASTEKSWEVLNCLFNKEPDLLDLRLAVCIPSSLCLVVLSDAGQGANLITSGAFGKHLSLSQFVFKEHLMYVAAFEPEGCV